VGSRLRSWAADPLDEEEESESATEPGGEAERAGELDGERRWSGFLDEEEAP
jgi:hypothetical protein